LLSVCDYRIKGRYICSEGVYHKKAECAIAEWQKNRMFPKAGLAAPDANIVISIDMVQSDSLQ
jgi:hypothetical protein